MIEVSGGRAFTDYKIQSIFDDGLLIAKEGRFLEYGHAIEEVFIPFAISPVIKFYKGLDNEQSVANEP